MEEQQINQSTDFHCGCNLCHLSPEMDISCEYCNMGSCPYHMNIKLDQEQGHFRTQIPEGMKKCNCDNCEHCQRIQCPHCRNKGMVPYYKDYKVRNSAIENFGECRCGMCFGCCSGKIIVLTIMFILIFFLICFIKKKHMI